MRHITAAERTKRGCIYCADKVSAIDTRNGGLRRYCPHAKCPYTALDKYDKYEDFIASEDSKIDVSSLFATGGGTGRVMPYARTVFNWSLKTSQKKLF